MTSELNSDFFLLLQLAVLLFFFTEKYDIEQLVRPRRGVMWPRYARSWRGLRSCWILVSLMGLVVLHSAFVFDDDDGGLAGGRDVNNPSVIIAADAPLLRSPAEKLDDFIRAFEDRRLRRLLSQGNNTISNHTGDQGPLCARSLIRADTRTCLAEFASQCFNVTRSEATSANCSLRVAARTHSTESATEHQTNSIMRSAIARRLRDDVGHNRTFHQCGVRNAFLHWNTSYRLVTRTCTDFNATQRRLTDADELRRLQVKWTRTTRGNVTLVREWSVNFHNTSNDEILWWTSKCALWVQMMHPLWERDSLDVASSAVASAQYIDAAAMEDAVRRMSAHVSSQRNVSFNGAAIQIEQEVRRAVTWAIHETLSHSNFTCPRLAPGGLGEVERRYLLLPHHSHNFVNTSIADDTNALPSFCKRTNWLVLLSWLSHFNFLDDEHMDTSVASARKEYDAALKLQREAESAHRDAHNKSLTDGAQNGSDNTSVEVMPLVFRATEDDPEIRENSSFIAPTDLVAHADEPGCLPLQRREVRVAFVGDSTSVAFPRRIVEWTRRLCTKPCVGSGAPPDVNVHYNNFAVSAMSVADSEDDDYSYLRTVMYRHSIEYEADVVVVMLGTNDALRCTPEAPFDEALFTSSLQEILWSYLRLPSVPDVLVLTPAPVFDAVFVNVTRPQSRKHRTKTYLRRQGYAFGSASVCMATHIVPAIVATVKEMAPQVQREGDGRSRLMLSDLHSMLLDHLTDAAVEEAHVRAERRSTNVLRDPSLPDSDALRAERLSLLQEDDAEGRHHLLLRNFPLKSVAGQLALSKLMPDGCHHEKAIQKDIGVEVLRQLWLIDRG